VTQGGSRYCKEHDKTVTWIDNSATTPCTLTGSFGTEIFIPTMSEWSSSSFFIKQIEDANNPATTYTFTVTGLGAPWARIDSFQLNFTQASEFDEPAKDLRIVLNASKSFGGLHIDQSIAKITGNTTIINSFKCGAEACTGATKYRDVSSNTCLSSCGSKYIGISSAKGYLCLTPSQCDSYSLAKDSLQLICSDCTGSNSIQKSILSCISNCGTNNIVSIPGSLNYCAEKTSSLTFSDFSKTKANT
jgi:hypothetical protein